MKLSDKSVLECCVTGDVEKLREMLSSGVCADERDEKGRTGLHILATRGQEDGLEELLSAGLDVNIVDKFGNTPLHYCGHIDTIQCLVEAGADVFARNKHGDTPATLMKRKGVADEAIKFLEDLITGDSVIFEETAQPLLVKHRVRSPQTSSRRDSRNISWLRSVWYEFCLDLGVERLIVVLLVILVLSLYVAYAVTGLAKGIDTRIPVDESEVHKLEL